VGRWVESCPEDTCRLDFQPWVSTHGKGFRIINRAETRLMAPRRNRFIQSSSLPSREEGARKVGRWVSTHGGMRIINRAETRLMAPGRNRFIQSFSLPSREEGAPPAGRWVESCPEDTCRLDFQPWVSTHGGMRIINRAETRLMAPGRNRFIHVKFHPSREEWYRKTGRCADPLSRGNWRFALMPVRSLSGNPLSNSTVSRDGQPELS
jgi:hypothetical protein